MNKFFKGSISILALSTLLATSATAQIVDAEKGSGYIYELGNTPTGAVETVYADRFENYNMSSTEALVGQFAALNGLNIRGSRSTSGTDALILIDGFEQSIEDVDILDIEKIQILKDAAATASYGIRGGNGIILITTKRGSDSEKPEVSLKFQKGFIYNADKPDMVGATEYNSVIESLSGYTVNSTNDIDWADEMLKPIVHQMKASAQVAGSSSVAKYFASAIFERKGSMYNYDDNAVSNFSGTDNIRFRSNLELKLDKNTTFTALMSAHISDTKTPEVGDATLLDLFYNTPASRYSKYTTVNNTDGTTTDYYNGTSLYQDNPYASLVGRGYDHKKARSFSAQGILEHKMDYVTEGLYLKGTMGFVSEATVNDAFEATYMSAGETASGDISTFGTTAYLFYNARSRTQSTWHKYSADFGYDRVFGDHSISAILGAQYDSYQLLAVVQPYNYFNLNAGVTYSFQDRFTAQFTTSYGGDNALDSGFVALPTLGLAWKANDMIKVRGSIGRTATDELGDAARFMYIQTSSTGSDIRLGTSYTSVDTMTEDQYPYNGTYETAVAINLGVDLNLMPGLNVSVDYFNETRSDIYQTYSTQVSATWGGTAPVVNYGKVHSQGVELIANYAKTFSKDLNLNASLVAGYSRNIVKQTYEYANPYYTTVGGGVNQVYGLVADGIYELTDFNSDGSLVSGSPVPTYGSVQAGDIKYVDQNDDNVIDEKDKCGLLSDSNPIDLGLNVDIRYKRFRFGLTFDSQLNSQTNVMDNIIYSPLSDGYGNISTYAYDNAWSTSNQTGTLPRLSIDEVVNNSQVNSLYVVKTNYLRLRTAMIGYTFPLGGSSLGVNLCAHNLFTLDSLPKSMNATNLDYAINGSSVTIGVDFNF